jgi:hypothetical protein
MNKLTKHPVLAAILGLVALASNSCETTGGSSAAYYYDSSGFNDPWYYGAYYDEPDFIVAPPGTRPDRPVAPTHPIARPPMTGPRPMPAMRGGGGRGGGRR